MKCDRCGSPATVHMTEIQGGKKITVHLCQQCADQVEGMPAGKQQHQPINELLTNFVLQHSGQQQQTPNECENCGITWGEFRQSGLFGCEHDYDVFEKDLSPLLQRAHEGGTHHVGKVPRRRGASSVPMRKSIDLARLRKELTRAVEAEDYENAAKLRDQIREAELAGE